MLGGEIRTLCDPAGTKVFAKYRTGDWIVARVIERVELSDDCGEKNGEFKYYVHYKDVRASGLDVF